MSDSKSTEEARQKLRIILAGAVGDDDRHYYGEFREWCDECQSVKASLDEAVQLFDQELDSQLQEAERFNYDLGYKDAEIACAERVEEARIDEALKAAVLYEEVLAYGGDFLHEQQGRMGQLGERKTR